MNNYHKLHELSRSIKTLQGIDSLLGWDQETYMPHGGAAIRAEQIKTLAGLIHKEKTSKKYSSLLGQLIDLKSGSVLQKGLSTEQAAALREWRRDYHRDTALPRRFVEDFAKLASQSVFVWEEAKQKNHYPLFLPYLDKIIAMNRKKADLIGYRDHPYDALLDEYEPGITTKEVNSLFDKLRKSTKSLFDKINSSKQINDDFLTQHYDEQKQSSFNEKLLQIIDFPKHIGRLDLSAHPFSSSPHPTDNRITTRIIPNQPFSNIRSVLHEAGHAFYEMGLPVEQYGTPLGEPISLGMHESQSRWWETRIGLSKGFWELCLPLWKKQFENHLGQIDLNTFWKTVHKVEPSYIRVEADEVTYTLHVILRFELEVSLIEGKLAAKDIPDAWNEKMKELLAITPPTYREGCLQDVHWSMGAFGYFPTYTLGNLYAAHFFQAFEKTFPDWEKRVAAGEFTFIKEWLGTNIHQHGRRYSSKELIKKVTGETFSEKAFCEYLQSKYSLVYEISP